MQAAMRATGRRVRWSTYRWVSRRVFWLPGPPILANSLPKAGTHLLARLLGSLPNTMRAGGWNTLNHFRDQDGVDWGAVERTLATVRNGQYFIGHFPRRSDLDAILDRLGMRAVVMVRDPRDVVVSTVHYAVRRESHFLHRRFVETMDTDAARIMALIRGIDPDAYGRGHESIAQQVRDYAPWHGCERAIVCRFEDLIGPQGGGTREAQLDAVDRIARFLERDLSPARRDRIAARLWSSESPTFRRGAAGSWRDEFDDDHRAAFKSLAGDALVALGYEQDEDW